MIGDACIMNRKEQSLRNDDMECGMIVAPVWGSDVAPSSHANIRWKLRVSTPLALQVRCLKHRVVEATRGGFAAHLI
jgi:hypothetical protein